MKRVLSFALILLIVTTLAAGCGDVKKDMGKTENTVKETVQKETNEKEFTAGTVIEYSNDKIVLESGGEKIEHSFKGGKAVFVEGRPEDIKEGAFVKIIKKDGEDYVYVTNQGKKEDAGERNMSVFGILREAENDYVVVDINGKEEKYIVADKAVMQKFSDTNKVMRYNKDKLKKGNWVIVLVDKNNEVMNIVY